MPALAAVEHQGDCMRVLLVEDDPMIGAAIQSGLRDVSHAVDWVTHGTTALQTLAVENYDVVLLDLGLPGRSGLDVLRQLRSAGTQLPVLVITARDGVDDRVKGLDEGADDYLVKPFAMKELLARMRAVQRRLAGSAAPLLSNGLLTLDPATREVSAKGGGTVPLTNREFALLHALMTRPGTILSRSELEGRIYGWGEEVESNAVEYLIHAIRKKLGSEAIKNVRGAGWMAPREP